MRHFMIFTLSSIVPRAKGYHPNLRGAPPQDGERRIGWFLNTYIRRYSLSTHTNLPSYISNIKDDEPETIRIEVVSKEFIKPSSPTPQNLRCYKLSIFDQYQTSMYNSITFFYPNRNEYNNNKKNVDEIIGERLKHLKQSLSETLTLFYPFAGKVASEFHIDCNDDGVYFIETRVDNQLVNVLTKPNNKFLQRLVPSDNSVPNQQLSGSYISMVQVNFFNCGGCAVTTQYNHKLVDGPSGITFLKAWAAIARQDPNQVYPSYVSSSMFPQIFEQPGSSYMPLWRMTVSPAYLKQAKCSIKRFAFDALALRKLKATASKHYPVSRITAVLALLWKCIIAEMQSKKSFLHIPVNIRPRCSPPMPESTIGNNLLDIFAMFDPDENDLEVESMACQLKNAIADVDNESIEKLQGERGQARFIERVKIFMETISNNVDVEHYKTTSICNSGIKEVDFGWGKPMWSFVGNLNEDTRMFMNRMILMDSCSGDGIEVWVTLEEHVMNALTNNSELLSFASVDPSPL